MKPADMTLGILCGGKSRRMGRDKASLVLGGETLLQRAVGLGRSFGETLISIGANTPDADGCRMVRDERPDCGPLEGLYQLLNACRTEYLMVLPVDMPFFGPRETQRLSEAVPDDGRGIVLISSGTIQPLCAVYSRQTLPILRKLLDEGERRVWVFAESCGAMQKDIRSLGIAPEAIQNLNTPEDLASAADRKER